MEGQVVKREWNRLGNNLVQSPEEKKPMTIRGDPFMEG
jgi:hypothetical protein